MRLVFFDFNINYGGGPQGSVYLVQRLCVENEVHIIDAYGACDLYRKAIMKAKIPFHVLHPNTQNVCIGGKGLKRFRAFVKQIPDLWQLRGYLIKRVLEINPDVIWVNNEKSLSFLVSSFKLLKYPLVIYMRGWATPDQINNRLCWLLKHKVKAIIAHSMATIEQLKQRGIPESKIFYTANAVDFKSLEKQSQKLLDKNLPGNNKYPKILLPAARIVREKGHHAAVKAIARLKEKGYSPILWLPGKVATGIDNAYLNELKELISQLGVEDSVDFIGWRQDIPAVIKAADIVILPTHTEGFPRVILEAMLLRKPVCATPVGGVPEAIEDDKTGFLVGIDDDKALAERLDLLAASPDVKSRITEYAYGFVVKEYDSESHTNEVTRVFKSVSKKK